MKKEYKVISLSLAKELQQVAKEKGFELPESKYAWRVSGRLGIELIKTESFRIFDGKRIKLISEKGLYNGFFAYDISELREILPKKIRLKTHCIGKSGNDIIMELCFGVGGKYNKFYVAYGEKGIITNHRYFEAETEAEARGKMLIYLIENNLLKK